MSGGLFGEIEKIEGAVGRARAEPAVAELNMLLHGSQDHRRHLLPPRNEIGERLREQSCGVAHGAARMRSAAHLHHVGVTEDDLHALNRHAEKIGNDLGEARLVTLSARLRADDDFHPPLRAHRDPCLLVRRAD